MRDKIMEAGFDHPCRQTCSGWQQGYDRGMSDLKKDNTTMLEALNKIATLQSGSLDYTQDFFEIVKITVREVINKVNK